MSYKFDPHYKEIASWEPDHFLGRQFPVRMPAEVIIEKGQNLAEGSILGKKPNGKYVLSAKSVTQEDGTEAPVDDGSEIPSRILSCPVDARASDMKAVAYRTGSYIKSGLTIGEGHTLDDMEEGLELRNIYFEEDTD
ncbi:head decoration protein [Pseudobacteriovorax antillogorgiicola]|uniref:Bacteriophage lambda head decoration protein D n=1 Tax=Pseudobacteriovorax antillogorgiicola TaxID=1513793 RepID=A0A1Y6CQ72_9BACT|nr:head decoration protein [Pseudobacteriovorax antillogorgiicola]TCS44257.1 bacteriophage lambda head decoration protein D [Pseudobacteriovorax antillogorgiicola]SMF80791.1 Bacteriophage lambda head decoration protein D [Pseudobacteriovorax antillogorgiicola]